MTSTVLHELPAAESGIAPMANGSQESVPPPVSRKITVFTNGCFDLLHRGHIHFLRKTRMLGNRLIVGLNADDSVRRLKGDNRPIRDQWDRMETLMAIRYVSEVIVFHEDTPCDLIGRLRPDIIVKGPGYTESNMPEAAIAKEYGGRIVILDGPPISTTDLIETILQRYSGHAATTNHTNLHEWNQT